MAARRVAVPGSEKKPLRNARAVDERPADEQVTVTIRVRRKKALPKRISQTLTSAEYEARYGASESDLDKVAAFAKEYRLDVIERVPGRRDVDRTGRVVLKGDLPSAGRRGQRLPHRRAALDRRARRPRPASNRGSRKDVRDAPATFEPAPLGRGAVKERPGAGSLRERSPWAYGRGPFPELEGRRRGDGTEPW